MRALLAAVLAVLVAAPAEAATKAPRGLRSFDSCAQLVRYARTQAARVVPVRAFAAPPIAVRATAVPPPMAEAGAGGRPEAMPSAAPAAPGGEASADSGTNVQEAGVDEPDVMKADARRALAITDGHLRWIDLRGGAPRLVTSLGLPGWDHRLLVRGDRALVIGQLGDRVLITELDVGSAEELAVRRTLEVPGGYVGARLTGGTARIVVSTHDTPGPPHAVRRAALSAFVPRTVLRSRLSGRTFRRRVVRCDDVARPVRSGGPALLSIMTFDLDRGMYSVDRDAVIAGAQAVYASPRSLVVASTTPDGRATALHRFDTTQEGVTRYRASGEVPGTVLNQFSLSEHEGVLRVATTRDVEESFVTTLREAGGRLVQAGQVGGLGRGERIYAVRFLGETGYVVTFRQVDPLYVVDLADPERPRVRGELKILGYSAYLHPVGDGLLLGVGVDATEEGRRLGAQVSLFDVSDPAAPRRLHARTLGESSSTAVELDHHAFLWWAPAKLAVLPVHGHDRERGSVARALRVDRRAGIGDAGTIEHRDAERGRADVARAVVAGGRLLTLSGLGLAAHRVDGLGAAGFAAFPAPPPGPPPSETGVAPGGR